MWPLRALVRTTEDLILSSFFLTARELERVQYHNFSDFFKVKLISKPYFVS